MERSVAMRSLSRCSKGMPPHDPCAPFTTLLYSTLELGREVPVRISVPVPVIIVLSLCLSSLDNCGT